MSKNILSDFGGTSSDFESQEEDMNKNILSDFGGTSSDFGSQEEDMNAINVYLRTTKIVNNSAFPIKDDFIRWWDNLSWWNKTQNSPTYDEARTRRNKFQLANVVTQEDRAFVQNVIATGIETEEMQGKPRPPINPKTGAVGTQVKNPTVKDSPTVVVKTSSGTVINKPTLSLGSKGPDVIEWQGIVGVTPATGFFGDMTVTATKNWQRAHGLTADGVVGPNTWKAALGESSGFAPGPKVASGSFAPTPRSQQPKTSAPVQAPKSIPKVATADMLDFSKWPLWAQITGALTIIGGAITYAFSGEQK